MKTEEYNFPELNFPSPEDEEEKKVLGFSKDGLRELLELGFREMVRMYPGTRIPRSAFTNLMIQHICRAKSMSYSYFINHQDQVEFQEAVEDYVKNNPEMFDIIPRGRNAGWLIKPKFFDAEWEAQKTVVHNGFKIKR